MDKGILLVAQNNNKDNYIEQAYALAMSVKKYNDIPVSIITNDKVNKKYFDSVIPIVWGDMAQESTWKIENRWKVFFQTPYKETLVMDTDMLVMRDITYLWDFYKNYDLFFTTNPITYRNEKLTSNYYRKMFEENKLTNVYSALYYFKKTEFTHNFFSYLEIIVKNFDLFQKELCPALKQESLSMDVAFAMTIKLMDIEDKVTNAKSSLSTFVHMKSHAQNWKSPRESWQNTVPAYYTDDLNLYVGGYKQNGIFHYTEKSFLDRLQIIQKLGTLDD